MFWDVFSPEIVSYLSDKLTECSAADRKGPQGPRSAVSGTVVRALVRMVVFAIAEGPRHANSLTDYLQLYSNRPGLGECSIRHGRWKRLTTLMQRIDLTQLSEYFTASFLRFWNIRCALWIAFDESIVPYTGYLQFSYHIERKPNPDGALVYVACGDYGQRDARPAHSHPELFH